MATRSPRPDAALPSPPAGPRAPYAQVKQHLKNRLAAGDWPPGVLMPSEAELVAQFGVSRMTVNRALKELQADGLVERVQGVGTFAAQLHKVSATLTLRDLHEEIAARGHAHTTRVLLQREEPASAAVAQALELPVGTPVFHTRLVHLEAGVPLQLEDRHVNPAEAPGYLAQDFSRLTPTHYLFQHTALWRAAYAIEAANASADEADALAIAPGAACLVVQRRTWSRQAAITVARLLHPGGRYQLEGQFTP
ncbi:histidine utilization repressor [Ideonella livida]|uniref:Histidine utilization repressor n=1 Tax=Ideonella livida TaxID=2707176 RepID=A0A7C9PGQ5_9BURK|nr:histidine utilization repressor [Ideonella livida]NDY91328.1 histidine utilization repressor [Ideonella livida]